MTTISLISAPAIPPRRDVARDGEDPGVVVRDIAGRPRSSEHIIVFANEKGGVGKSTLAFLCCVALLDAGRSVAAIDLDWRQMTLSRGLTCRDATTARLGIDLPCPSWATFEKRSGAMLSQEIARIGWDKEFIIIDVAGHDSPIARRAIALADTLVTPVNGSFVDLDLLGRVHPTSHELMRPGVFAQMVIELREERQRRRLPEMDWVVPQNRIRPTPSNNQAHVDQALASMAPELGFRLMAGLGERVAYRELFLLRLSHLDLKRIPQFANVRSKARDEIRAFVQALGLPAQVPTSQNLAVHRNLAHPPSGRAPGGMVGHSADRSLRQMPA